MAKDKEHIRRLLHEVANTKGHASAQKSQELLDYVTNTGASSRGRAANPASADNAGDLDNCGPNSH